MQAYASIHTCKHVVQEKMGHEKGLIIIFDNFSRYPKVAKLEAEININGKIENEVHCVLS